MNIQRRSHFYATQQGIVLPVVLIMLLVLTIASLVIVEQISSQTRMATNASVQEISLEAAEAGLQNIVSGLFTGTITSAESAYLADASGFYYFKASNYSSATPAPWNTTSAWTSAPGTPSTCGSTSASITSCQYIIEMLPPVNNLKYGQSQVFRITVRVVGPSNHGVVMLQTTYLLPVT